MAGGRPPAWLLGADQPSPVDQDARDVDPRGRLSLPSRLAAEVSWLRGGAGALCLGVLDLPGRVRLLDWEKHSAVVLLRQEQLLAMAEHDDEALEDLRVLRDRYRRLRVEPGVGFRMNLPLPVTAHLELAADRIVHVVRLRDEIELWSAAYRFTRLHRDLEGVP